MSRPETAPKASPPPAAPAPKLERTRRRKPVIDAGRKRSIERRERLTQGKRTTGAQPSVDLKARTQGLSGRDAAIARRRAIAGVEETAPQAASASEAAPAPSRRERVKAASATLEATPKPKASSERRARPGRARAGNANKVSASRGRMASMARRAAAAERGKTGVEAIGGRSRNAAATTLMRNAGVSSREIAKKVREERCERGKCDTTGPRPTGRARKSARGESAGGPHKVETSETAAGQSVTGTKVGRAKRTTGDEAGSCRSVTGTEYMGAEVFQEFCGFTPEPAPTPKTGATLTAGGQDMTGSQVGRSTKVTGDETGAGRTLTGTPYTAPGPEGAPPKVQQTETYRGRSVTGSLVGRRERMTGNEPGTCQRVTGDEYLGAEQLQTYCKTKPEPNRGPKVGVDATWHGQQVSGTQVGRSKQVTGDEPGSCEIVTGTSYLGAGSVLEHCGPKTAEAMARHASRPSGSPGAALTGLQPGIGGVMTGAAKGECQSVTGTPYVGLDQAFAACGEGAEATPGSPDFPQPIHGGNWDDFSVSTPARVAQTKKAARSVTGTAYDDAPGRITGPFNMANDMVTGTENFRQRGTAVTGSGMAKRPAAAATTPAEEPAPIADEPQRPRITGEGMDGGTRITGDDWGRNERVTGTEGTSSTGRNPTRRGSPMGPFAGARAFRDAQDRDTPELNVTGSSGSTDRGALVTVSGGARG
ncbi:CsoS2 family carboxysome shell protein [Thiorhodococcus minor]|uniref:CsoS2 family carboxysome shell protein n=1 Tax=Thiorhodococcus minor TaxID=57489 RepID=UPI003158A0E3